MNPGAKSERTALGLWAGVTRHSGRTVSGFFRLLALRLWRISPTEHLMGSPQQRDPNLWKLLPCRGEEARWLEFFRQDAADEQFRVLGVGLRLDTP